MERQRKVLQRFHKLVRRKEELTGGIEKILGLLGGVFVRVLRVLVLVGVRFAQLIWCVNCTKVRSRHTKGRNHQTCWTFIRNQPYRLEYQRGRAKAGKEHHYHHKTKSLK